MGVSNKIMGVFMVLFGLFMTRWFPTISDYQRKGEFSWAGVIIGVPCIYFGIYLLFH